MLATLKGEISKLDISNAKMRTTKDVVWTFLMFFGWLLTTSIAVWAAINSGK
jgi:hypothetical protein